MSEEVTNLTTEEESVIVRPTKKKKTPRPSIDVESRYQEHLKRIER